MTHVKRVFASFVVLLSVVALVPTASGQPGVPIRSCGVTPATVDLALGDVPTDGDDVIYGTEGDDVIDGGGGNDLICALGGDDVIVGSSGRDSVFGGEGNDRITTEPTCGPSGNAEEWLGFASGGLGDDVIVSPYGIEGGDGDDRITLIPAGCTPKRTPWMVVAAAGDGNDVLVTSKAFWDLPAEQQRKYHWDLWGEGGDDTYRAHAPTHIIDQDGNNTVYGGRGQQWIDMDSGTGDNVIRGGPGQDRIGTGAGNDVVHGGPGKDRIGTGEGDDVVRGGAGDDTINGGHGNDVLRGGAGDDFIQGSRGKDRIHGGPGEDQCLDSNPLLRSCEM